VLRNHADVGALREAAAAAAAGHGGAILQDEIAGLPAMDEENSMQAEIEAHYKVRVVLCNISWPASTCNSFALGQHSRRCLIVPQPAEFAAAQHQQCFVRT
jgi:hypothetical protein